MYIKFDLGPSTFISYTQCVYIKKPTNYHQRLKMKQPLGNIKKFFPQAIVTSLYTLLLLTISISVYIVYFIIIY